LPNDLIQGKEHAVLTWTGLSLKGLTPLSGPKRVVDCAFN